MVTIPKKTNKFCSHCKSHQEHVVTKYVTGKQREIAQGKRRYDEKQQGYGGQKKPIFHKKAKLTKNIQLNFKCKECQHIHKEDIGRSHTLEIQTMKNL